MASNKRVDMQRTVEIVDGVPVFVHQKAEASGFSGRKVLAEVVGGSSLEARLFLVNQAGRHFRKRGFEKVK